MCEWLEAVAAKGEMMLPASDEDVDVDEPKAASVDKT